MVRLKAKNVFEHKPENKQFELEYTFKFLLYFSNRSKNELISHTLFNNITRFFEVDKM